jgi:hypothetical protein
MIFLHCKKINKEEIINIFSKEIKNYIQFGINDKLFELDVSEINKSLKKLQRKQKVTLEDLINLNNSVKKLKDICKEKKYLLLNSLFEVFPSTELLNMGNAVNVEDDFIQNIPNFINRIKLFNNIYKMYKIFSEYKTIFPLKNYNDSTLENNQNEPSRIEYNHFQLFNVIDYHVNSNDKYESVLKKTLDEIYEDLFKLAKTILSTDCLVIIYKDGKEVERKVIEYGQIELFMNIDQLDHVNEELININNSFLNPLLVFLFILKNIIMFKKVSLRKSSKYNPDRFFSYVQNGFYILVENIYFSRKQS